MKSNLLTRFIFIFAAIGLAVFSIYCYGLKGGIDLSGGTDLIYQLNIPRHYEGHPNQLAQQVISVLRRRVDPSNVDNLVWRVLSGERIEIQMPLADAASRAAQKQYQSIVDKLMANNIMPSQVHTALAAHGTQRAAELAQIAGNSPGRLKILRLLSTEYDTLQAVNAKTAKYNPDNVPDALVAQSVQARSAYEKTFAKVLSWDINIRHLANLLSVNAAGNNPQAKQALQNFIAAHRHRKALILQLVQAYGNLQQHSGGLNNPAELERMLRGAGVLDFRIAVNPTNPGAAEALTQLASKGPHSGFTPPQTRWFLIDPQNGKDLLEGGYVVGSWEGRHYILLHDNSSQALVHGEGRQHWKVQKASLETDPSNGGLMVAFNLDPVGGAYMRELTGANKGRDMAILLDGKAITAPVIKGTIGRSGQITLGAPSDQRSAASIQQEAHNLVRVLNAGSLPATLQSQPISVQTIGATLGADNLRAGLRSAVIAVIVVLVFMFAYYTITGAFADMALIMNLILLLGIMSGIHATFTLPGIAGVVLTLGMAVDANILINERIREELHKGASLWLAVKQGYDRVFWTIFDANLTTSLTSVVLIFAGSEDVKGFGVTLLIGLAVHMFTALFVTRTLMIAAIRWGVMKKIDDLSIQEYFRDLFTGTWLRGRWPFMRVFTLTDFDWIAKRYYFWIVSGLVMILGITAFIVRGNKKYDTEFNGGTQITLQLATGKTLPVADVRTRIRKLAQQDPQLKALSHATVYAMGTKHNSFTIITSIVNPSAAKMSANAVPPVQFLSHALEAAFADVIKVTRRLNYANASVSSKQIQQLLDDGTVAPIAHSSLRQVLPGMPNVDVSDYRGGVALVLRNIAPAVSVHEITSRIQSMSQEPDFAALQYRPFKVIPIRYAPGLSVGHHPLVTEAVVAAVDQNLLYDANKLQTVSRWKVRVAAAEWRIVRTALQTSGGLAGVNSFAPQVASEARWNAITSVLISLLLIVAYVWIRFGGIRYGFGVIFSLCHDAIVAVAATVLAVYIHHLAVGKLLLVDNFKINMTMIAAYLTIIGYSVNDTIVIFDRVRENRGRSRQPLTRKLVNDSINQCFGRTIWTTFTVFAVVFILYVWGGPGVHGFAFAMLIGVFTGAYSTLAIASPMLLHVKDPAPVMQPTAIAAVDTARNSSGAITQAE